VAWLFASDVTAASLAEQPKLKGVGRRLSVSRCLRLPNSFVRSVMCGHQFTTLLLATSHGYVQVLRHIKKWGLITAKEICKHKQRVLDVAVGHLHVLQFFKEWGVITLKDIRANKHRVLYLAAKHGHAHVLQFLKDWRDTQPAKPQVVNGALQRAAKVGEVIVGQLLRVWGEITPDATAQHLTLLDVRAHGNRVLNAAAKHGHVNVLAFLKQWGMTAKDARANNNEALYLAAVHGHVAILQFLKDQWGLTATDTRTSNNRAISVAAQHEHIDVLRFLRDEWHLTTDDIWNGNALYWAVVHGNVDILQLLREWGLTVSHVRQDTTLAQAAAHGHVHVLEMFKGWHDDPGEPGGKSPCLTLKDVRRAQHLALRQATDYGNIAVLQFFKDWRDPDGSALSVDDIRMLIGWVSSRFNFKTLEFLRAWLHDLEGGP
jgi:hypothetical protein